MTAIEKNRANKKAKHKVWKRRVRKEITHRKGKPLITSTMIRNLKYYTNPLEQLIIILTNCFPWLIDSLSKLTDIRNQSYTEYQIQEITIIRLLALCCGIQSMTEIATKLNKKEFIYNINQILNTDLKKFPCDDTISNIINTIKIEELEKLQYRIIKKLIDSKTLDKYRLFNNSFYIVIDGTGLFSTRKNLGKGCIYKIHNKDTDNEYTEYQYYTLEAKIVCGNYVFSFATEFVENGNMSSNKEKQDCELNASHRLLLKIRDRFPKLPITIGADSLYVNKPFIDACKKHKMNYILRYKDTVMTTISKQFKLIKKKIIDNYEYVNFIGFGSGKNEGQTNIIKYNCPPKKNIKNSCKFVDKSIKTVSTEFTYITSLKITKTNYAEIVLFGRNRWKIENQGFKDQKSRILNINHCYTFNNNGTKVNYYFIQIAHVLITILYYGSSIIKKLHETKVEVANLLYQSMIRYLPIDLTLNKSFQIRFD